MTKPSAANIDPDARGSLFSFLRSAPFCVFALALSLMMLVLNLASVEGRSIYWTALYALLAGIYGERLFGGD